MRASLPAPRVPDPLEAPRLRWGVMGPGWIAERFVAALRDHTNQVVTSVGSRDITRAREFASRFGIARSHGSYDELAHDERVDVVYVATPHPAHLPCAVAAITAGKPVLVEKPLAVSAAEARYLTELAGQRRVFCMEALWTDFLPKFDVIRQLIADAVLGDIRAVLADHGEWFGPDHRIMRPELAGGPLFDLGTYPVALAIQLMTDIDEVQAVADSSGSGVNGQIAVILKDRSNRVAMIHSTITSNTPTTAVIAGTEATLSIDGPFYRPGPFTVTDTAGSVLAYQEDRIGYHALSFEAAETARCIAAGARESTIRPLDCSIRMLDVMDRIRSQL
jgi:predicted dehydrogenase